ncbi:MAG: hypothetical protein ABSC08_08075 [Bryobacteraceae bacterium]
MVEGFIDSASAYEVILVLARPKPEQSYKMEWDSTLAVTATLINTDYIRLAPSPQPEGAASGAYGVFLSGVEPAISRIVLPEDQATAALQKTRKWAGDNVAKLRSVLRDFTYPPSGEPTQAGLWLEAHIGNEWHEHVLRRGALFDREFATQLARVLDIQPHEVVKIWSLASDPRFVATLAARRPDSDDFRLIRDAFVVSSLLRGRYHDYAAEISKTQLLSHPVRESVYRRPGSGSRIQIQVSNTERYLANIVVAAAFGETSHERRVALWVENVLKLRRGRDQVNLAQKDRDETARDTAIEAARKFEVRAHSRLLENVLDVGIGLGSAALTSFALLPWESMIIGSAISAFSVQKKLGERVMAATMSTGRLNQLSKLVPGRVEGGRSCP